MFYLIKIYSFLSFMLVFITLGEFFAFIWLIIRLASVSVGILSFMLSMDDLLGGVCYPILMIDSTLK